MKDLDYQRYKNLIDEHLIDFLPDVDAKSRIIYDSMKYSLTSPGKRLRPALLLGACEFCGGKIENAIPYACAIEYIHTYSLIHDDLPCMDDDELRRGVKTNHIVFGDAIATLAGDGLLTNAFEIMNKDMFMYFDNEGELKKRVRASYELAKGSGCQGMIAGQVADMEETGKEASIEMLDYIHLNKTAALLIAAVRAGAHLAEYDEEKLERLTNFAECFGLAFQIADDILDVLGDEKEMGKNKGMDKAREKLTYPKIYGIDKSIARAKELTESALEIMSPYYDDAEFFNNLVIEMAERTR